MRVLAMDIQCKSQCCGGQPEEIKQRDIYGDGRMVGLVGLTAILKQMLALGRTSGASEQIVMLISSRLFGRGNGLGDCLVGMIA